MPKPKSFRAWIPPAASLAGGLIVLVCGSGILVYLAFEKFSGRELLFELQRDIGIALAVAGLVALLFEIYHHVTHQMRTTRDVIDAVMGEKITPEVWDEVNVLIERRKIIRRDVRIRLSLNYPDRGLQNNEGILRVEHDYNVESLSRRPVPVSIDHELDYQFRNETLQLPRFEYVEINPPGPELITFSSERLKEVCPGGRFQSKNLPTKLLLRPEEKIHVRLQRLELVNVPGAYNLYCPEFTKGLQIYFGECPASVEIQVWVRPLGEPLGESLDIKKGEKSFSCESLLLPGQGIEIKFLLSPATSGDKE